MQSSEKRGQGDGRTSGESGGNVLLSLKHVLCIDEAYLWMGCCFLDWVRVTEKRDAASLDYILRSTQFLASEPVIFHLGSGIFSRVNKDTE